MNMKLKEIMKIVHLGGNDICIRKEGKVLWQGFEVEKIPPELLKEQVEGIYPQGFCESYCWIFVDLK